MGNCETVKLPVVVDAAVEICPVARLRTSIGAFGMTAPLGSVTVPVIPAKPAWPRKNPELASVRANKEIARVLLDIPVSFRFPPKIQASIYKLSGARKGW